MNCEELKLLLEYLEKQVKDYESDNCIGNVHSKTNAKLFKVHLEMERLSNLECF